MFSTSSSFSAAAFLLAVTTNAFTIPSTALNTTELAKRDSFALEKFKIITVYDQVGDAGCTVVLTTNADDDTDTMPTSCGVVEYGQELGSSLGNERWEISCNVFGGGVNGQNECPTKRYVCVEVPLLGKACLDVEGDTNPSSCNGSSKKKREDLEERQSVPSICATFKAKNLPQTFYFNH